MFTVSSALLDKALLWRELQDNKILLLLSLAHSQNEMYLT